MGLDQRLGFGKPIKFHPYTVDILIMENQNKETQTSFFHQLQDFLVVPFQAWRRTVFFEFGANSSLIGVAISSLFIAVMIGATGLLQYVGGLSAVFSRVHWLDLVALKRIDDSLQGPVGSFLSALAIFSFIFGSFGVLRLIESVFDQQWGKITVSKFAQRIPTYWMTLTIVPSFLGTSIIWALYLQLSPQTAPFSEGVKIGSIFGQFVLSAFALTACYKIINHPMVAYRSAFVGGFWAALCFEIVKTALVATSTLEMNFSSPVGTFFVYAIFLCIGFVFVSAGLVFGNHIAYTDQYRSILEKIYIPHQKTEQRPTREIALAALIEMTRRFYIKSDGEQALGIDPLEIASLARTTPQRGKNVIRLLENVGLVKIIQDNVREIAVLKIHPESLSLDEFLARLEQRMPASGLNVPSPLPDASNTWFWQEYERALKDRFGSLSLKDLAELSMIMKQKQSA
ncbi:MAG: YhjD/YihY/BrkB family envelope integrity protein [Bdellovibrionales bacterium]